MKVSIITVCYNSECTIEKTVQSVLVQDYSNIEYVIVDGASLDGTLAIIDKYKTRISTVVSEKDKGLYDALNKGIQLCSGDIIGILHSDDIYENEKVISEVVKVFEKNNCDGVYGDLIYTKENDLSKTVRFWKSKPFKKDLLKKGWMPAHPTLFLKKRVYRVYGNFDLRYKIAADYDFMLRILKQNQLTFSYLPKVITKMRLGGASNASIKHMIRKSREDYKVIRKNEVGGFGTLFLKNFSKITQFLKN